MAIIYRSESTLIIGEEVWIFQVIALVFILIGGMLFAVHMVPPFYINCNIKQPQIAEQCTIYQMFFANSNSLYMDKVTFAGYTASQRNRGRPGSMNYSLYLSSGKKISYLQMMPSQNRGAIGSSAQAINNYIQTSNEKSFRIPHLYSWGSLAFVLSFPSFGIFILVGITAKKVTFDKNQNKMIVESRRLFFLNKKKFYSLDEIDYITIAIKDKSKYNLYDLECVFTDKNTIPLSTLYSKDYNSKKNELKAIAKLGIPIN